MSSEPEGWGPRLKPSLPFFVSGGVSLVLAVAVRGLEVGQHGDVPVWPPLLLIGAVLLVAASLLLWAPEDGTPVPKSVADDEIVVKRKEWEELRRELTMLKKSRSRDVALEEKPSQEPLVPNPPATEAEWAEDKDEGDSADESSEPSTSDASE